MRRVSPPSAEFKRPVQPIPATPGRTEAHDDKYVRNGTANLFMLVEPPRDWRQVDVTRRRTKLIFLPGR